MTQLLPLALGLAILVLVFLAVREILRDLGMAMASAVGH